MKKEDIEKIEVLAHKMRKHTLDMAMTSGLRGAHISGSLSCIEIYAVLYHLVLKYDLSNPEWDERDRMIAGKEHARLAEFPAMAEAGFFPIDEILKFEENGGLLTGHQVNLDLGLEYCSCSLGHALPYAVGKALYAKQSGKDFRVFSLVGDAESDEGSIWEAVMIAAHFKLGNLTLIVDRNYMSVDGNTEELMAQLDMKAKFKAFGWDAVDVDGHNIEALYDVLTSSHPDKPLAVIAKTVKGKGISFIENNKSWHQAVLNQNDYEKACEELANYKKL